MSLFENIIKIWEINRLREVTLFGVTLNIEENRFYNKEKDIEMIYKQNKYILLRKKQTKVKINLKENEDVLIWILIYTFLGES